MAQERRTSARERMQIAQQLFLGLPKGISIKGAQQMEELIAYLYTFRVATLEQLTRCLPGETEKRVGYWLDRYPHVNKKMVSLERYDVKRGEWIRPKKIGMYSLTPEALIAYEFANKYEQQGYTARSSNVDYKPRNIENTLRVIELFTRVLEVNDGSPLNWIPNQLAVSMLRQSELLKEGDSLSTTGFIQVEGGENWGIATYLNQTSAVVSNTKKTFPPHYYQVFGGIMLVRDEHLSRAQEIAYNRDHSQRGDERNGYYRFVHYEFSLKHPKWFLGFYGRTVGLFWTRCLTVSRIEVARLSCFVQRLKLHLPSRFDSV